jgi:glycerate dehydrogenase
MFTKGLVVDIDQEKFWQPYLSRMKKQFQVLEFVSFKDRDFQEKLKDADAILCMITTPITKEVIDAAPKLRYIGVRSTSFAAIDTTYARAKGITVCNLGSYSTNAVAEFTIAALWEAARNLETSKQRARSGEITLGVSTDGIELRGKTLGVIGAGNIGSRVAEIGLGIGMKVLYSSRHDKPELNKKGARRAELDEILKTSDCISLNLLSSPETKGMISKEKISLLKKGCIFVSPSPHDLIDSETMRQKAQSGDIKFVFDHAYEIPKEEQQKFVNTPNCYVYAPIAIDTPETMITLRETFAANVEKFLEGKPQNVVN